MSSHLHHHKYHTSFLSLNTVLTSGKFKGSKSPVIPAIENAVKDVFCNNKKQYTNKVKDFLSDSASKATIENS